MSRGTPKVTILLSTFNGAKFLDEQLTSLSKQVGVQIQVYANDDGSEDSTFKILEYWQERGLIETITTSERIGATRAYLAMLKNCEDEEFIAFCDQDDIWDPEKIILQVREIDSTKPTMVFSAREYVDSDNRHIGNSQKIRNLPSFNNALIENIAGGNTILLNRNAIKIVNSVDAKDVINYDAWIYLLLSALGECKYIPKTLVRYRIHTNNSIGLRKLNFIRLMDSIENFRKQASILNENAAGLLSIENRKLLECFLFLLDQRGFVGTIRILNKKHFERQKRSDYFSLSLMVVIRNLVYRMKKTNPSNLPS